MKSSFFEYEESEQPIQEVWDDSEAIFVLDTNIFLNLYVFHEKSRQLIYEALDKIKERLWSPHQVMLEFHRNRERHIDKNKKYFNNNFIDDFLKQFTDPYIKLQHLKDKYGNNYSDLGALIDSFKKNAEKEFAEDFDRLHKTLKEKLSPIEQKLIELQSQLITSTDQDSLYQKLCELYPDNKIGKSFTQPELDELYKEGEQRFQHNVPPGYQDKDKREIYHHRGIIYQSKFGDLIIYKQILEHCKKHKIKNVIFVSEDSAKGDWIDTNTKMIRQEIKGEAFEVAGIQNFVMMNLKLFSEYSKVKEDILLEQDFDRADSLLKDKEKNDLSIIGTKVYQIVKDDNMDVEDKIDLFKEIIGRELSDEDYWAVYYAFKDKSYSIPYQVATCEIRKAINKESPVKDYKKVIMEIDRIIELRNILTDEKISILQYLCDNKFSSADITSLRGYIENEEVESAQELIFKYISPGMAKVSNVLKTYRKWGRILLNVDPDKEDKRRRMLANMKYKEERLQNRLNNFEELMLENDLLADNILKLVEQRKNNRENG